MAEFYCDTAFKNAQSGSLPTEWPVQKFTALIGEVTFPFL
jgi:hypothetical protein